MSVILAALSLGLTALAASARQQEPQPEPGAAAQPGAPSGTGGVPPVARAPDSAAPDATAPALIDPALAERLSEFAQFRLRQSQVTEPMWRQAAALLNAASRLSPNDARFPRLLVEARLKVGDTDGALDALNAYRKADPADRIAQIQLIDLYVAGMQTADAKLEYLRGLLDRSTIPEEVRSHVAAQCVPLLMERSQEEATAMVEESLKLFPLNPAALRLKYQLLPGDATPAARAAVLLTMLRSNPAQPGVIAELCELLSSVGLSKEAIEWAGQAMRLYPRMGQTFPDGFVANLGGQLLMTGETKPLESMLDVYLQARPDEPNAWFLQLLKAKAGAEKLEQKSVDDARNALAGRLGEACTAIAAAVGDAQPDGNGAAPAQPGQPAAPGAAAAPPRKPATADEALAAAKRVKAGEGADWESALVSTLTDLAWLELFFAEDADAAGKWVVALRELLPADSVTLARLDGWLDLVAGRTDQAREKLAPIADRDPLAAVGMIRLAQKDAGGQAGADEAAARVLGDYRTGLVGAMVWSALRDRGVKPAESPLAADVSAELKKFPRDWMEIVEQPDAYYEVQAEVLKVAHKYQEPFFAKVTIQNKSDFDLTIGTDGVIRPDLWFDARMVGLVNHPFPGVAVDRIARHVVLRGRQSTTQHVRIDQGELQQTLSRNPSASAKISVSVLINPSPTQSGIGPGPAGMRKAFNNDFIRSGFPLSQSVARKRVMTAIRSGTPAEKVRSLDLLNAYAGLMGETKEKDPAMLALGKEFVNTIVASRDDPSPVVSVWATYLTAAASPEQRAEAIDALLASPAWPARLLGLLAAERLPIERQLELTSGLAESDPDPTVKAYAASTAEYLRNPPSTQPEAAAGAGQPQSQPAGAAGAAAGAGPGARGPSVPSGAPAAGGRNP
jgi:predicted Zn-dependent protease